MVCECVFRQCSRCSYVLIGLQICRHVEKALKAVNASQHKLISVVVCVDRSITLASVRVSTGG